MARGYAYQAGVDAYYDKQAQWKSQAQKQNCAFIPAVSPGFNDRGVRIEVDHLPLARKLSPNSPFGTLFQASLKRAVEQVDPSIESLLIVNSFNEWHEDSQIEPVIGNLTDEPFEYTQGLEYEGYQDLYLNILQRVTTGGTDYVKEIEVEIKEIVEAGQATGEESEESVSINEFVATEEHKQRLHDVFDRLRQTWGD
jgi:hypothetical protein